MGGSREQFGQRKERFIQFLHTQEISYLPIADEFLNSMQQMFLVFLEGREEIATVTLSHKRRMYLTAHKGPLKTRLLAWKMQETIVVLHDVSDQEDLEKLETYHTLLQRHTPILR